MQITNNPLINYVRESKEELSKVSWPNRQRVLRDTLIVVALGLAVALILGGLDYVFSFGLTNLINRFR